MISKMSRNQLVFDHFLDNLLQCGQKMEDAQVVKGQLLTSHTCLNILRSVYFVNCCKKSCRCPLIYWKRLIYNFRGTIGGRLGSC